jgi:colicin import membrane protein/protein TonB
VVGLHVLTAVALVAIKTPKPQPEPQKDIQPVEIQFVTLPAKSAAAKVETKELLQEVTVKKGVQPKAQAEPVQKPKTEPQPKKSVETPTKPVVKKKAPEKTPIIATEKTYPDSSQRPSPKETQPEPKVDTSAADEQRKEAAARAKKAAQEAQDRAAQEAKRVADNKAAAQAKAAREAEAAAQAKAAREAAEAAAQAEADAAIAQSNEPVSFTASAANWASAPNFSFPERVARRARSGDTLNVVLLLRVNKQGGIDSVSLAKSSGNSAIDKEAQRQVRSGKFKPFTNKSGVPVVGNVTLPISYAVP